MVQQDTVHNKLKWFHCRIFTRFRDKQAENLFSVRQRFKSAKHVASGGIELTSMRSAANRRKTIFYSDKVASFSNKKAKKPLYRQFLLSVKMRKCRKSVKTT